MISVFKNFYNRPASLNDDKVKEFMEQLTELLKTEPHTDFRTISSKLSKVYPKPDVRRSLAQLYHQKCAYCEQKTDLSIEYYRPKSKYPWLLMEWSNMLPVCHACNVTRTNKFLIKGKEITWTDVYYASNVLIANMPLFKNEQAVLLHPEVDSPENHISFDAKGTAVGRTDRGRYTIDAFALNRELLLQKRAAIITSFQDELKDLAQAYFHGPIVVRGDNFVSNIAPEFDHFYKKLFKLQQPENEFSALYRSIWEDDLIEEIIFTDNEDYNQYIVLQMLVWKKVYLLKKNKLLKTKVRAAVTGFTLQNFEAIRHISLPAIDASSRWIFLTGENGFGKTSVLKAIAAGLTGKQIPHDEARFSIDVLAPSVLRSQKSIGNSDFYDIIQYTWQHDLFKPYLQLAAYGANRTRMSDNYKNPGEDNVLDSLFGRKTDLLNVERFLIDTNDRPELKEKFSSITKALITVIPQLSGLIVDDSKDILEVKYFERGDDGQNFQPVSFNELATGMRSVLAMVGDIMCRFMINKDVNDTKDIEGIVIIDELDIHLHPKWQRALPELLSEVFPKVQFIASTHSPIPLLGAPKHSVFLKVFRDVAHGVQIERLTWVEENLPNMLPNVIYTSELFGMESISSVANENKGAIMTQDNIQDAQEFKDNNEKYKLSDIDDKAFLEEIKAAQRK